MIGSSKAGAGPVDDVTAWPVARAGGKFSLDLVDHKEYVYHHDITLH
jgi:hypothetical protein